MKKICAKWVENGTFTDIVSTKNMRACAKQHKKLKINNIPISH